MRSKFLPAFCTLGGGGGGGGREIDIDIDIDSFPLLISACEAYRTSLSTNSVLA